MPDIIWRRQGAWRWVSDWAFDHQKRTNPRRLGVRALAHAHLYEPAAIGGRRPGGARYRGGGALGEPCPRSGCRSHRTLQKMAERYDVIGDVRGPGLFIGVDYVEDRKTKTPASAACVLAWEFAIEQGLITQFGGFAAMSSSLNPRS